MDKKWYVADNLEYPEGPPQIENEDLLVAVEASSAEEAGRAYAYRMTLRLENAYSQAGFQTAWVKREGENQWIEVEIQTIIDVRHITRKASL